MIDMTSYPALPAFAIAAIALFLKVSLTSAAQVVARLRSRAFLLPEDAALMRVRTQAAEAPFVQRCANVWRNDSENLPLFLVLALTYTLTGASPAAAPWLFGAYVAVRYLHTAAYLRAAQPWRAILYLTGMLVCWIIAVRILLHIAGSAGMVA
jgi:uncharacterized MAPEG superfamily protein